MLKYWNYIDKYLNIIIINKFLYSLLILGIILLGSYLNWELNKTNTKEAIYEYYNKK